MLPNAQLLMTFNFQVTNTMEKIKLGGEKKNLQEKAVTIVQAVESATKNNSPI